MEVANTQACCNMATIIAVKSFIVEAYDLRNARSVERNNDYKNSTTKLMKKFRRILVTSSHFYTQFTTVNYGRNKLN